nr:hypothetical protein [Mucilaginibacter sp. L294]
MKKRLLILLPVIILLFGACKKDEGPYAGFILVDSDNSGGDDFANTYMPTSTGSSWTYITSGLTAPETMETHITGVITNINGSDYFELKSSTPGKENIVQYYYVKDHVYKTQATSLQTTLTIEFYYLKDDLPIGGEWTGVPTPTGSINGVPARTLGKILEKDISKTVLGKTYTNVIHTQVTIQYNYGLGNGFEDSGTYDYYLAKGVGLIESDANVFGVTASTKLSSYTIK